MANEVFEPGFNGRLISLGGIAGKEGAGRQAQRFTVTVSAGVGIIGLPSNGKRISATVQIFTGSTDLQIYMGDSTYGPAYLIGPTKQMFQIDKDLPWTGSLYLYSTGALSVIINEVSVST